LVFAATPISGPVMLQSGNIVDSIEKASTYVKSPSFNWDSMDFYPLSGKCQGGPIDLSDVHTDSDYSVDFNGTPKVQAKGAVVYRGAYAGEAVNPGWQLQADVKPFIAPTPMPTLVWLSRLIQNYGDVFWNRLGCGSQALGVDLGQKRV